MYLISLPGSWHRAPQAFEIYSVIIAYFLIYEESLLSTQEFMLMSWLRLESLSSIKMRLVTWKTKRLQDWKWVGLEIQFYKNSWTEIWWTSTLLTYPNAERVTQPNSMSDKISSLCGDPSEPHPMYIFIWLSSSLSYFIHIVACELSYVIIFLAFIVT